MDASVDAPSTSSEAMAEEEDAAEDAGTTGAMAEEEEEVDDDGKTVALAKGGVTDLARTAGRTASRGRLEGSAS